MWYDHTLTALAGASFFTRDPILLGIAAIFGTLPDLDFPFGHRGWFSHSLLAICVFSIAVLVLTSLNLMVAAVAFIALFSHLLIDLVTKSGIPLLFPLVKEDIGLRLFESSNKYVNRAVVFVALALLFYNLGPGYESLMKQAQGMAKNVPNIKF